MLQLGTVILAAGIWLLHATLGAHGLHTTTLQLAYPEIAAGLGMGILIGPLFDFIIAAVDGDEVGSAAGVQNAVQQLAGALGVATLGTLFFSTLGPASKTGSGFDWGPRCLALRVGTGMRDQILAADESFTKESLIVTTWADGEGFRWALQKNKTK